MKLHHFPFTAQQQVVEFNSRVEQFIDETSILKHALQTTWVHNYFNSILDTGLFFKFPKHETQRLFWEPSLNGGLPMCPKAKKGPMRELIFFCHDMGHFLLPPLVYTGEQGAEYQQTYILYRLLGEATTLVLSEMVLVEVFDDSPLSHQRDPSWDYDWPYLLYQQIKTENLTISELLWANVDFLVKGDWSSFEQLLARSGGDDNVLQQYGQRYETVNKRGVLWNIEYFQSLQQHHQAFQTWWDWTKLLFDDLPLFTLNDMHQQHYQAHNRVNSLYSQALANIILPSLSKTRHCSLSERNYSAFKRLMLGNLFMFFKQKLHLVYKKEINALIEDLAILSASNFSKHMEILQQYRHMLKKAYTAGIISEIQFNVYCDIAPWIEVQSMNKNSNDQYRLKDYLQQFNLLSQEAI